MGGTIVNGYKRGENLLNSILSPFGEKGMGRVNAITHTVVMPGTVCVGMGNSSS